MKKYKPLGSVVLLKNGTKRVMIYGRKQILASTGELFDYVACLYPEGNIHSFLMMTILKRLFLKDTAIKKT